MADGQPPPTSPTNGADSQPELDVKKLHSLPSEQQDLYLLNFTAELANKVASLDSGGASAHQLYVKKELFKVINLSSPPPTRVIRNNLARSFVGIFTQGDRKLLFDTINDLATIINTAKVEKDLVTKHAAIHCLGAVYEAAGDSAINLSVLVCSTLLRALKAGHNAAGLRGSIFKALGRIFVGIGGSADEAIARDVWKQARAAAANDKSAFVQKNACICLAQLVSNTPFFNTSGDFDRLQTAALKAIDSPSQQLRLAAAACMSAILVKSYSDNLVSEDVPKLKRPKKASKKGSKLEDDDDDMERLELPAAKSSTMLSFAMPDLLRQLSAPFCKPATSNRARAGLALCYIKVLRGLGENVVESKYGEICRNLFLEVLSAQSIVSNRYRLLITRKFVRTILEDVVGREILGESAQIRAAKFLINDILKDFPQAVKERPEPSKQTLTAALSALSSLIKGLGFAIGSLAESCRDSLLQVLMHPSYTVQIHTAHCLRAFVVASPQQLLPSVTICMNSVNRELNLLSGPRQSPRRCVGYANGLAAVLSTSTQQPLYGSVDVYSRVLSQATTLLKTSGSSDLRISATQLQVAWILLGGLMSLGPNFVKIHLSQLLLLWKNALPKPLNKDNMASRNILELSFLAHVRECALGAMLTFLDYNSRLLTLDVTKRLAAMLHNSVLFLNSLPSKKSTDDITHRLSPALQLHDYDTMVRRRVFQCYAKLIADSHQGSSETLFQSSFLPLAISCFADPESHSINSLSASIASSAGNFESIWEVGDNYAFGVTSLVNGFDIRPLDGVRDRTPRHYWISKQGIEADIDRVLLTPACGALEHDSIVLYKDRRHGQYFESDPPATEVVNAAIQLFATALPSQPSKVQESLLEQLNLFLSESDLQRNPARKAAMSVNIATALFMMLKVAVKETKLPSGNLRSESVEKLVRELLRGFLLYPDHFIRNVAAQAIGRLCRLANSQFTVKEVDQIIDIIVSNREPTVRSGCALALGNIYAQLGGMAAGFHLKKILGVLNSLSSDPHPTVHFWALESISMVADSAALNFAPFVNSTIGMLAQLYMSESHNEETSSVGFSNLEDDLRTPAVIARCIDSAINVLGPDLQDMTKARELIVGMVDQFQTEDEELVLIQSLKCQEHLYVYAPGHMNFASYVQLLQRYLDSEFTQIRSMAIDGLHNLMRRNADEVVRIADPGLEEKLWIHLDEDPEDEAAKNIMRNWFQQTGLSDTAVWVQRCSAVLTKMTMKKTESKTPATAAKSAAVPTIQDEEVAGFTAASGGATDLETAASSSQELLRWQTRTFAMDLLGDVITMVARDAVAHEESAAEAALQGKVADIVRIAFSASTAGVVALRIRGLKIIDQILKLFGKTPDPDFTEASLLEQYQAQIASALTPAFAADSSPELAAEAVNVCATFVCTGIVTDVDRMGRILKTLVTALENFSNETETAAIGDLSGLSSNALVMVKMAIFSAWAELQIASAEQKYLVEVLKPHIAKLTPLWLASLREYARLRFEPDSSATSGPTSLSGNLDSIYAALNRETLLQFYQSSWLNLVEAIASLIDEDSEFVFDALDGKTESSTDGTANGVVSHINYRDEPVAFFFVLFGLAFEALVSRSSSTQTIHEPTLGILQALKKILRPSVSGQAIYQEVIFSETMDMLDRLVLTGALNVQSVIVQIVRNLCLGHPSARKGAGAAVEEEKLSEDIDQLFELTRIIVLVLSGLVPNLTDDKSRALHELNDEAVTLLTLSLSALADASAVFPSVIKTDLYACITHIFAAIMATPSCQQTVVPQALPIFKRFVASIVPADQEVPEETAGQLRAALMRFLSILKHAQNREFDAALQCEKNILLVCTILLSTAGPAFAPDDPVVLRFIAELAECLESRLPTNTAANCARSLLLLQKRCATDEAIAAALLPRLLSFAVNQSDMEGLDESRTLVCRTLATFVLSFAASEDKVSTAMSLVVPALLARASTEGRDNYRETATRLLELAAGAQTAFRGAVASLSPEQKSFMEDVIKEGGIGKKESVRRDDGEPSIALKMDF